MPIEIFEDKKGEWRFRIKARNGKVLCQSEGYRGTPYDAKRNIANALDTILQVLAFDDEWIVK